MPDLLRADIEFPYDGKTLLPGDLFTTQSEMDTKTLTAVGYATLVEQDAPVEICNEIVEPVPTVETKRRGRPKGSKNKYRRRDMVAE